MIRSMTGFGGAAGVVDLVHYSVELRSLNNRYFKLSCRLPEALMGMEGEFEQRIKKHMHRGSITLTVKLKDDADRAVSKINDEALAGYLTHLRELQDRLGVNGATVDLTALLSLPGVLSSAPEDPESESKTRSALLELIDQAADKLNAMRRAEGQKLAEDLAGHLQQLADRATMIRGRRPLVLREYEDRLCTRVKELIKRAELDVDKVDLLREVAIYADRSDIAEELDRTDGHLEQFRSVLERETVEPDGRTLDFISQELLREANTIASKSADATIAKASVEMKSAIDRIKEQVQNVE